MKNEDMQETIMFISYMDIILIVINIQHHYTLKDRNISKVAIHMCWQMIHFSLNNYLINSLSFFQNFGDFAKSRFT